MTKETLGDKLLGTPTGRGLLIGSGIGSLVALLDSSRSVESFATYQTIGATVGAGIGAAIEYVPAIFDLVSKDVQEYFRNV